LEVGDSEDGAFWTAFLRSLRARGLAGVQLVISDAHTGLKAAISAVMAGAAWQREGNRRARRHLATRPGIVTEVHDDTLISTTPRDAAVSGRPEPLSATASALVVEHPLGLESGQLA
jgi:hypothetical protein